jgi:hypothetical protein
VLWFDEPCRLWLYADILEDHAVFIFRAEVRRVKGQECWSISVNGGEGRHSLC